MAKNCKNQCVKKASIGGQALIEGIMMRGPKMTAMAVRDPDGKIVLEKWKSDASPKSKLAKLPIIRGVYGFISSMISGYKCLMRSAELSGLEEAEEELRREKEAKKAAKAKKRAERTDKKDILESENVSSAENNVLKEESGAVETVLEETVSEDTEKSTVADTTEAIPKNSEKKAKKDKKDKESSPLTTAVMIVASFLGVALSVGLFIFLPILVYEGFSPLLPESITSNRILDSFVKSVFEGVLRIVVLVCYMLLVSLMKDIRRTFMYHGAEHKTIFCHEHGKELTVENVRREGRFHPRCGTSFLILMLIVGIFVSFFIDPALLLITQNPELLEDKGLYLFIRFAIKLLLTPLIMGIGYELIKFAGRHDNLFTKIISAPGVWLQHITVLEPDDKMIECAIKAFVEVLPEEEKPKSESEVNESTSVETSEETDGMSENATLSESQKTAEE